MKLTDKTPPQAAHRIPRPLPPRLAVRIDEAAAIIGLGRTKIYELMAEGKLEAVAIERRRLVIYASIEALLAKTS